MQEMYREEFWRKRGRPRELYPDASSKDAPVPPDLLSQTVTVVSQPMFFNQNIRTQPRVASTHVVGLM